MTTWNDLTEDDWHALDIGSAGGLDEDALHDALDSYGNKANWSADITPELQTIIAQTSLISGARINVVSPVSPGGTVTLYRGSDYRVRNNTEISIPISDPGGTLHAILTDATQVASIIFGAGEGNAANRVVGTVNVDNLSYASDVLTAVVELSADGITAPAGEYEYHIKTIAPATADECVRVAGCCVVRNQRATP